MEIPISGVGRMTAPGVINVDLDVGGLMKMNIGKY